MIAASASLSTSDTKSLGDLLRTVSTSRFCEARLMIVPARRAALTAVLSIGCSMSGFRCAESAEPTGSGFWRVVPGVMSKAPESSTLGDRSLPSAARAPVACPCRAALAAPSRQHRRGCAGDEDDGPFTPVAGHARAFPGRRGLPTGFGCPRSHRRGRAASGPRCSRRRVRAGRGSGGASPRPCAGLHAAAHADAAAARPRRPGRRGNGIRQRDERAVAGGRQPLRFPGAHPDRW